jgi:glycogen debranching enzyme
MLKAYLDWWYRDRYDTKTGLISSVFEETFVPYLGKAMEYAGVDTNVEIYVGLIYTANLAHKLGKIETENQLRSKAENLKNAINSYLWDDEKGAYYPFDFIKNGRIYTLMASTFYPLRMNIADEEQKNRLITLLKDDSHFNWNAIPLTSISKKDPAFQTTTGDYKGNASWSGNVWTLINEMVIRGLLDSGEKALAAELALKTVYAFNNNCTEFINPFDGSGHGVLKYAWTASQYLELIIEVIFGISSNITKKEVRISPNLCDELKAETISIKDVMVFGNVFLDVCIDKGKTTYKISDKTVNVKA